MPAVITLSPAETRSLGARLGKTLSSGDLVSLEGDLGSGKTTFVQGLVLGWGSPDRVTSPTFVLVNEYGRADGARLYHMDAYRLDGPAEADDLDVDALLAVGPLVVEWADRIRLALPEPAVKVRFVNLGDESREILISPDQDHAPRD